MRLLFNSRRSTRIVWTSVVVAMASPLAAAALPKTFVYQLQARGNLAVNPGGSFNLPHGTSMNSTTVALNNSGAVASKLNIVGTTGNQGIFYGPGDGTGGVVAVGPDIDTALWGDVALGDSGRIVLPVTFSSANGLYYRDAASAPGVSLLTQLPAGVSSYSGLSVKANDVVGYRANVGGNSFVSYDPATNSVVTHASQAANGYSFMFTPNMNNNRVIVGRVTNPAAGGSADDQIRTFAADGTTTLIAAEGQSIPGWGTISSFTSNAVINDAGQVAVIIRSTTNVQTLFRIDDNGATFTPIATASTANPVGGVRSFAFFSPSINNNGVVAFRATEVNPIDPTSADAIFIGDGSKLLKVVAERTVVPTDLGSGQIGQENLTSSSFPAFAGGIAINDRNQVAFTAGVFPEGNNQVEWGTAIYIANPIAVGDVDLDFDVDADDIDELFSADKGPVPPADPIFDINDDGQVITNINTPGSDVDELIRAVIGTEYGDADLDGEVGFTDLLTLARNFDATTLGWAGGNFDGDAGVGFSDLLLVARNYGFGTATLAAADFAADWAAARSIVPEPASMCVLILGSVVALRRR